MESLARLKRGTRIEAANGELGAVTARLGREFKATNGDWSARAVPLAHEVAGFFRPALFALIGGGLSPLAHVHECRGPAWWRAARFARARWPSVRRSAPAARGWSSSF
jgi:hypothetical protein